MMQRDEVTSMSSPPLFELAVNLQIALLSGGDRNGHPVAPARRGIHQGRVDGAINIYQAGNKLTPPCQKGWLGDLRAELITWSAPAPQQLAF